MITVAAMGDNGQLSEFTSYGYNATHIAAPGVDIKSTYLGNKYGEMSGTASSGFVSGIIGLIAANFPGYSAEEIKMQLLRSAIPFSTVEDASKIASGGYASAYNALLPVTKYSAKAFSSMD